MPQHILDWVVVATLYIGLPLVAAVPAVRRGLARGLERVLSPARPDDEVSWTDDWTSELSRSWRDERLREDLERLRHLLLTDEWMSATRQLGNRLAYQQLRQQLAEDTERRLAPDTAAATDLTVWSPPPRTPAVKSGGGGVEILDFGWRA